MNVPTYKILLYFIPGVPKHLNVDEIKHDLMKIEDVYAVEDLNVWSLTTGKSAAIINLQLSKLVLNCDYNSKMDSILQHLRVASPFVIKLPMHSRIPIAIKVHFFFNVAHVGCARPLPNHEKCNSPLLICTRY